MTRVLTWAMILRGYPVLTLGYDVTPPEVCYAMSANLKAPSDIGCTVQRLLRTSTQNAIRCPGTDIAMLLRGARY
eukprot:1108356-Rhodomonas_salina.2